MAHWPEYADWWNLTVAEPLRVVHSMAVAEGTIGIGVEWDDQAIAHCLAQAGHLRATYVYK